MIQFIFFNFIEYTFLLRSLLPFFFQHSFELANSVGLEMPSYFKKSGHFFPINTPSIIDKSFVFFQILTVVIKKSVHMLIIEFETEFGWKEIIANKGHK